MVVSLRDGRTLERRVAHNLGTPDNPMTDQQLEDKLIALAAPVLGQGRTEQLAETCWKLLELDDIRALFEQTTPDLSITE